MGEPTIYKPSIYKGAGAYKNNGIYNGRGVYNDGAGGGSPIPPGYTAYDWIRFDGSSSSNNWYPEIPINIDTNEDCIFEFVYNATLMNAYEYRDVFCIKDTLGGFNLVNLSLQNYGTKTTFRYFKNGGSLAYPSEQPDGSYCKYKSHLLIRNSEIIDESILATTPSAYGIISMQNRYVYFIPPESTPFKSYGGKISKNGVTLYEFIPVKENDTGKCGFYDIVNNTFTTFSDMSAFSHWTFGND